MTHPRIVPSALETLRDRVRREVDEGLLPSCQWALGLDGEIVAQDTHGPARHGDASRYVLFSASKAIVSAAVWQLIGEGRIALDDPVAKHVPEFGTHGKEAITIEHLLAHTAGIAGSVLMPPDTDTRESRLQAMKAWPLEWEPGSAFAYHITSAHWVQAELLERFDGVDFRESIKRRISDPLGLDTLRLGVPTAEQGDIERPCLVGEEPTEAEYREKLGIPAIDRKEATDDNLMLLAKEDVLEAGVPGGGAVSNAADFALFWQALIHNPGKLWDPAVLHDATQNVRTTAPDWIRGGTPANRTLGLLLAGDDGTAWSRGFGYKTSARAFGHDGAGGQIAWADPETGLSFVYLTDAIDRNLFRQWSRIRSIASKAAVVVQTSA
ncbi:MAG: serine hydrolase domain-containing protein [Myxococcota bacterium]|nr:serine hydrolase domain-containing protein [Myxococcota bacterium]